MHRRRVEGQRDGPGEEPFEVEGGASQNYDRLSLCKGTRSKVEATATMAVVAANRGKLRVQPVVRST